jgi:uncharacterized membrane protein YqaE (UPF0057 family)
MSSPRLPVLLFRDFPFDLLFMGAYRIFSVVAAIFLPPFGVASHFAVPKGNFLVKLASLLTIFLPKPAE